MTMNPEKMNWFTRVRSFALDKIFAVVLIGTLTHSPAFSSEPKDITHSHCFLTLMKELVDQPEASATLEELKAFAEKHKLPVKFVEVGPPERRVKRMIVGLNFHKWDLMQDYLKTFHLESSPHVKLGGVLPMEYAVELERTGKEYVGASIRPRPGEKDYIWMFGHEHETRDHWWNNSVMHPLVKQHEPPIVGFAHLVGMSPSEQKNIWHYLYNPADRAPCKSSNCVAWQSMIELGKTGPNIPDAERRFLASELGFSRTIEHIEMARRMMHYSNDRNAAVVAFVNGEKGLKAFNTELEKHIPPLPKKSPREAMRGVVFSENQELGKALTALPDVKGGTKIFFPIAAGTSPEAMAELAEKALQSNHGIDVHVLVNGVSERVFNDAVQKAPGKFRIHALFLGGNLRKLHSEGMVNYIPGNLADFASHMRAGMKDFNYDAIVVRVSPPNAAGQYSLGPNYDFIKTVIESNPKIKVIAEVNPNVPFTTGDNFLTEKQISSQFKSSEELTGPAVLPVTAVETKIGENLAELIPENSTLQVGIGNAFGGLPEALKAKGLKNLKVSTEMFGDDLMKMVQNGVVKQAETGFAYGTKDLYHWLDHNPKVVFKPTEFTNNPDRIAKTEGFHAVNTAIQVDLYGQVNATMGPKERGRISSPGGQVEFLSGAYRAKNGKAIVALRSTALRGEVSAITMNLYPGPITTPQEYVTHVVTEYGIAPLLGKGERARAIALINIAHPKFRRELFNEALDNKLALPQDEKLIQFDVPEILPEKIIEVKAIPQDGDLFSIIKNKNIPAYLKKVGNHEIPVVLLNQDSYAALRPELDQSIGFAVELETRGAPNDHGRIRIGRRIMDFGTPGQRFSNWELEETGILARPMESWIPSRHKNFLNGREGATAGGTKGTYDGKPLRMLEVVYPVTADQKKVADLYFRGRHSGLWKADYFWTKGSQHGKANLLCHPEGGAEHCLSFATASQTQFHRWAIRDQLFHEIGIKDDLDKWFELPQVKAFQKKSGELIHSIPIDEANPETWTKISRKTLSNSDLLSLLKGATPKNLTADQQEKLANYLFADKCIEDYQHLMKSLGVTEENFLNMGNPNVKNVFVYDGPEAAEAFKAGQYEYKGAVFGIENKGTQRPLPSKLGGQEL